MIPALLLLGSALAAPFRVEGPWSPSEADAARGCGDGALVVRAFVSGKGWGWICRSPTLEGEGEAQRWQHRLSGEHGAAVIFDEGQAGSRLLGPPPGPSDLPSVTASEPAASAYRRGRRALKKASKTWGSLAKKPIPSTLSVSYTWSAGSGAKRPEAQRAVGVAPNAAWGSCAEKTSPSCFWGPPLLLLGEVAGSFGRRDLILLPERPGAPSLHRLQLAEPPQRDGLRGIGLGVEDHLPHRIWWLVDGERQEWRYEEWRALDNGAPVPFLTQLWVEGELRGELRVQEVKGSGGGS